MKFNNEIRSNTKKQQRMETLLYAEYIDYRGDYRLYNPDFPCQTVAYVDTIEEAQRDGYIIVEINY